MFNASFIGSTWYLVWDNNNNISSSYSRNCADSCWARDSGQRKASNAFVRFLDPLRKVVEVGFLDPLMRVIEVALGVLLGASDPSIYLVGEICLN